MDERKKVIVKDYTQEFQEPEITQEDARAVMAIIKT